MVVGCREQRRQLYEKAKEKVEVLQISRKLWVKLKGEGTLRKGLIDFISLTGTTMGLWVGVTS